MFAVISSSFDVSCEIVSMDGDEFEVLHCPIWPHDSRPIVDSTGAGDSYIGGFITGLLHGLDDDECMKLASLVASEKLRGAGARGSLPTAEVIRDNVIDRCRR